MRKAPQKQCETILLLQSFFLKMSESEHSDSEFYYPDEPLDAEMLQLPTHNETKQCCHTRVLIPPKKMKMKKNDHMIKCLLTAWGRAGL